MFGGNNNNPAMPPHANVPVEVFLESANFLGNKSVSVVLHPNKRGREQQAVPRQQKLQLSLNNNICHEEVGQRKNILNCNPVSTGLRLSYDDEERNSSIVSTCGSMASGGSSIFSSLSDEIRKELDQQQNELDCYIKNQEQNMANGIRDIKQKHMEAFLTALGNTLGKKLQEKDLELESINRKNQELTESMKQVTAEAQNWCHKAKYNESLVNTLKTNLQQAMQGSNLVKEGFGENDVDDATSSINPNNYLSIPGSSEPNKMVCRLCRGKGASVLVMPCRHLCLCKGCEGFVTVCPVCRSMVTGSFEVYLS